MTKLSKPKFKSIFVLQVFKYSRSEEKIAYHVDKSDGSKRIADATLVTMTLMIAESRPEDMEMMVKTVVNLMG